MDARAHGLRLLQLGEKLPRLAQHRKHLRRRAVRRKTEGGNRTAESGAPGFLLTAQASDSLALQLELPGLALQLLLPLAPLAHRIHRSRERRLGDVEQLRQRGLRGFRSQVEGGAKLALQLELVRLQGC